MAAARLSFFEKSGCQAHGPAFLSYDMEPELPSSVYSVMEKLGFFQLRLIGGKGMSLDLLAENALIAIYRAAAVAIESGATDFQLARRPIKAWQR